jgi:nucleotide-binding universal stress UspA family protein
MNAIGLDQASGWPPRRIVCGTDFSPHAERAAQRAALLAMEHHATLVLAHVVPTSLWDEALARLADLAGADMPGAEAVCAEAAERLRGLASRLDPQGRLQCEVAVEVGRPAPALAKLAMQHEADLLVVADRGMHGLHDLVLGTTAQQLLRTSPCPLLVVKRPAAAPYGCALAPTDFSSPSREALRATASLLPHAKLYLAHAFELPFDGILRADISPAARRHYVTEAQRRLQRDLHTLADDLCIEPARRVVHVEHGYPGTCIERWAEALQADLVAVAAFGKSAIEQAFVGSVSLHTVSNSPCDVLLLRGLDRPGATPLG